MFWFFNCIFERGWGKVNFWYHHPNKHGVVCRGFLPDNKRLYFEPKHTFKEFEMVSNRLPMVKRGIMTYGLVKKYWGVGDGPEQRAGRGHELLSPWRGVVRLIFICLWVCVILFIFTWIGTHLTQSTIGVSPSGSKWGTLFEPWWKKYTWLVVQ